MKKQLLVLGSMIIAASMALVANGTPTPPVPQTPLIAYNPAAEPTRIRPLIPQLKRPPIPRIQPPLPQS